MVSKVLRTGPQDSAKKAQRLRKLRVQIRGFLSLLRSPFHNGNTNVQRNVFMFAELLRSIEIDLKKHKLAKQERR